MVSVGSHVMLRAYRDHYCIKTTDNPYSQFAYIVSIVTMLVGQVTFKAIYVITDTVIPAIIFQSFWHHAVTVSDRGRDGCWGDVYSIGDGWEGYSY